MNGAETPLFAINPALDRAALARRFAAERRVQIRDFLTSETANEIRTILSDGTPYGFAYLGEDGEARRLKRDALTALPPRERTEIGATISRAAARGDYAVRFNSYSMLDRYAGGDEPQTAHHLIVEHLNAPSFMELVREITGIPELMRADAQATVFAPGDFLSLHEDSHVGEGWRVAYVLNLSDPANWKPDWGGYLNFFDADGDVVSGWRPRFNALNLFAVPQAHNVSYVPPFAPAGRFAITGWFRDR